MKNQEIVKQMIDLQKTSFENCFSTIVIPQDKAEKVFTSPTLRAEFVLVPAGTFQMGKSGKQHQVTINKPFYMQKTHVTQGQWNKIMGSNPSFFKNCGDDCPVENVSWNDVQEFISKLNNMEGTDKYRLPTETQWEYAARSGGKQEEFAGTSCESDLGDYAWYKVNSGNKTHPVGQKKPNGLGLYDMSGNVWQWVNWYDNYTAGQYPVGPSANSFQVRRGGSWLNDAEVCRTTYSHPDTPTFRSDRIGFRLARSP